MHHIMSRAKVITKKTMDDPELQELFNQMVGTSEPNPEIIAPKYDAIMDDAKAIIRILDAVFVHAPEGEQLPNTIMQDFKGALDGLTEFVSTAEKELKELTIERSSGIMYGQEIKDLNKDPKRFIDTLKHVQYGYDPKLLGETYKKLKEAKVLDRIIIAVRDLRKIVEEDKLRLKKANHDIELKDKLSDSFIREYDGDFLQIIPSISVLDFKQMWIHNDFKYNHRKRIIFALHLLLARGTKIVRSVMSPDIDVELFSEKLIENIDKIRKLLPRCDKAFNKIKQSVHLLKNNFSGYYKDFVVSKNPGIIIENFISDVSQTSTADIETTRQFRKIVEFYRSKMGSVTDPKVRKIFDLVGENLSVLEQKSSNSSKKSESKNPEDSDEDN